MEITLYESCSLKDKRRIIKSLIEKIKNRYNVSVAEVDQNDKWKTAVLGMCTVSNSSVQVNRVLNSVIDFIERDGRVFITGYYIDVL